MIWLSVVIILLWLKKVRYHKSLCFQGVYAFVAYAVLRHPCLPCFRPQKSVVYAASNPALSEISHFTAHPPPPPSVVSNIKEVPVIVLFTFWPAREEGNINLILFNAFRCNPGMLSPYLGQVTSELNGLLHRPQTETSTWYLLSLTTCHPIPSPQMTQGTLMISFML